MSKYFSHVDGSIEFYDDPMKAKAEAGDALEEFGCDAGDGWPEEADGIIWGEVLGWVESSEPRPATPGDNINCELYQEKRLVSEPLIGALMSQLDRQAVVGAAYHGCLTGDCPHENANECLAQLTADIYHGDLGKLADRLMDPTAPSQEAHAPLHLPTRVRPDSAGPTPPGRRPPGQARGGADPPGVARERGGGAARVPLGDQGRPAPAEGQT